MVDYPQRVAKWQKAFGYKFNMRVSVNGSSKKTINQHDEELERAFLWVRQNHPKPINTFVELGVEMGGTLYMYAGLVAPKGQVIGVDMGPFPAGHPVHKVFAQLRAEKLKSKMIMAMTGVSVDRVRGMCPNGIDLLHIDASHGYEDVSKDWKNYSPMVNKGGIILFHDTRHRHGVTRLWNELTNFRRTEILIHGGAGIGCLIK